MQESDREDNALFSYQGHKLIIPKYSFFIPYATFFAGEYDFLKPSKNDVVLDAGANIGDYTLLASLRAKTVVAVEPLEKNLQYLRKNVHDLNNVKIVEKAIGREPGVAYFDGEGVSAHVDVKGAKVFVTTIDSIFETIGGSPTLVKMDIEGAEADALMGMSSTINHVKRLVIEVHDERNKKGCEEFLKGHGYHIHYISKRNIGMRSAKNIARHILSFTEYDKNNDFYGIRTIMKFATNGKTSIPSVGEKPGMGLLEAWRE